MSQTHLLGVIECLLFAAGDEGLTLKQICSATDISEKEAETIIEELKTRYNKGDHHGITVTTLAGTYQLATKREFGEYLKKLVEAPGQSTISQAGLETLAIIAYNQPITRIEIEEIRGVKTERPLQTLISKGLIMETGRAEGTGRPKLYGTTTEFLDYFGLDTLQDLPPLPNKQEEENNQEDADLFFSSFKEDLE